MSDLIIELGDLAALANDLGKSQMTLASKGAALLTETGRDLRDAWRANARQTAGAHGTWYPSSLRWRAIGPLSVEVGPSEGMKQAGMSFEFGSRNQPPHLDGQRALDAELPKFLRRIEAMAVFD